MSFFKKLFNTDQEPKEEKVLPWQNLVDIKQLDTIEEKSKAKTQLIFKHSTRCGISRMVLNQFVDMYDLNTNADLYYLDLLNFSSAEDAQTFLKEPTATRIWSHNSNQRKTALTQVVAFLDSGTWADAKA